MLFSFISVLLGHRVISFQHLLLGLSHFIKLVILTLSRQDGVGYMLFGREVQCATSMFFGSFKGNLDQLEINALIVVLNTTSRMHRDIIASLLSMRWGCASTIRRPELGTLTLTGTCDIGRIIVASPSLQPDIHSSTLPIWATGSSSGLVPVMATAVHSLGYTSCLFWKMEATFASINAVPRVRLRSGF